MKSAMKKLFYLVIIALLSVGASAQSKKTPDKMSDKPLTVIVMDTTQALLNGAEVKIGKTVFRTSFDGRVVLEPKQLLGAKTVTVSCDGFFPQSFAVRGSSFRIVKLTPKPRKVEKTNADAGGAFFTTGAKASKYYERREAAPSGMMAADLYVEEAIMPAPMAGSVNHSSVSAGKLTAGEVNDFAKWFFWSKVMNDTHTAFVDVWNIAPRQRFTAQVMTRSGAPVAGRAVSLLDANGNTLFQAVTDNTGKAELWANLLDNGQHIANCQIRVDNKRQPAKPWSDGLNTFVLDEECETSDIVDVVFVFDATGSMGDELRYLQAEMKDVIARAEQATGGLAIRTGAVVYRDHNDDYITRISRLTDDIRTTQSFIDKQAAGGGGDYPEAIPEALMAALNSSGWDENARAHIAFLVLDAPCHQDSVTVALLHEQILNAAALGVRIVPVVCSGLKESGEYLLRAIALATNGTSFFLTDDSGIGHSHLKPTTDSLKVEHLNDMLVRTIVEFSTMPACQVTEADEQSSTIDPQFIPNPFSPQDLASDTDIPTGEGFHYLVDVTGKLLGVFEGEVRTDFLPTGAYFIKTFVDGQWYTKKIFVR